MFVQYIYSQKCALICVVLCPFEKVSSLAEQVMVGVHTSGGGGGSRIMKGLDLL